MKQLGLPFPHTAIRQVLRTQQWKSSLGTGSLCCVTNHPNAKQLKTVAVLCSQNLWIGKFGPGTVGLAEALAGEVPTAERLWHTLMVFVMFVAPITLPLLVSPPPPLFSSEGTILMKVRTLIQFRAPVAFCTQ